VFDINYQTRLSRRGSVYYFRAKVLSGLKSHYHPKSELAFSLRTSDKREAIKLINPTSQSILDERKF